ncbi:meiosis 1 arrest protein isoform X2 [Paroedura picta]|uniref:meiosis 1 arrest protein isoform X2 n=1 Tax=Paroedura picta TaxID=143630 RepID=UPI0040573581
MNVGRRREPASKSPATLSRQPLRILVMDICTQHWPLTCHRICEALENVFSLVASLAGPPRIPLLSIYVAQSPPECLLPFVRCLAELRAFPAEGVFQPKEDAVTQAVKDGLQQLKQLTKQSPAGTSLSSSFVEVTVLTSQVGTEMVKQLEAGLQGIDLVSLHQLQVIVISRTLLPEASKAKGISHMSQGEASGIETTMLLGTAIDLQVVEDDLVSLETSFKAWLHEAGTDQEHFHLLLPPDAAGAGLACVKCDIQERLLDPALLPTAFHGHQTSKQDATGPFWMKDGDGLAPLRLRAVRVLKVEGLCASLLFGIPLIIRATSCWRLNWDELEANQHSFQALCHCLRERGWALLARSEHQEMGCGWGLPAGSFQVLLPSTSASLLLQSVAARELLLPCTFPPLPDDLPGAEVSRMEGILEGLQVEPAYNPLSVASHLYQVLRSRLGQPQASRAQPAAERHLPHQQSSRQSKSKVRVTVPPLHMAPPPASPGPRALCAREEEDFMDSL